VGAVGWVIVSRGGLPGADGRGPTAPVPAVTSTATRAPAQTPGCWTLMPGTVESPVRSLPVAAEGSLQSQVSDTCTTLRVVNLRKDGTKIDVYWLDFNGAREKYLTLAFEEDVVLQTYLTHPWVITAAGEDTALKVVLPTPAPGVIIVR
jgi:VHL beta domain